MTDSRFVEWFIGFSEGDGCFCKKDAYPIFVINQADLEVLNLERTTLGFGSVSTSGWSCLCATSNFKSRKYLTFNFNYSV